MPKIEISNVKIAMVSELAHPLHKEARYSEIIREHDLTLPQTLHLYMRVKKIPDLVFLRRIMQAKFRDEVYVGDTAYDSAYLLNLDIMCHGCGKFRNFPYFNMAKCCTYCGQINAVLFEEASIKFIGS